MPLLPVLCQKWPSDSHLSNNIKISLPTNILEKLARLVSSLVSSFFQLYYFLKVIEPNLTGGVFTAGLGAGVTEAVLVVCPMEVVKIRLQAQVHSMTDPLDVPKYRNAAHALYLILREEGPATLYRGVALTALRQSTNQG